MREKIAYAKDISDFSGIRTIGNRSTAYYHSFPAIIICIDGLRQFEQ